ncbi:NAD(P)/FAD-dependent oxidoreductase [Jatrophihabitans endophyticus]|uniref:dihydrolipoyl dehydrogenase family protein n=1 Tax=Jatrophihabitans endophyticus TaxID=1206085 RepID=UPI0019DA2DBB|nr:NAD(P)/FAD-dependent oxidoreductase [Jatrophihabitans endophyticus]MBE7187616.1 NAD(P)/FAD-dependent oxidoreductase [Jatrophihabitans endophyticus]
MDATHSEWDVIVLGLGPGGEDLAGRLAKAGKSVLAVDERLVGGECPYFGCIPSKMIVRAADTLAETARANTLAGHTTATPDFTPVADRIRDEATSDWDDAAGVQRLEDAGAAFVRATGALAGRADDGRLQVTVQGTTHTAAHVVVSTGTRPSLPPVDGLDGLDVGVGDLVWTNREILRTRTAPASMVVIGGGVIACELAHGFTRFGTTVTMIEGADRLLSREEPEAGDTLKTVFERLGMTLRLGRKASKVERGGDGVVVTLDDGSTVTGEKLLVAAGRTPNLDRVGLETVGLDPSAKTLDVDEHMDVLDADGRPVPGLHSIGDVTGKGPFTHVSMWQAGILREHLLGETEHFGGYEAMAWATFTDPEVGRVGMTEQDARDAGLTVRVGVQQIASDTRGWIYGEGNDGLVKIVEDADRGVLVGATVVGPSGGELIGMLTLAVHAQVPVSRMATMFYVFPTLHRSVLEAIQALK